MIRIKLCGLTRPEDVDVVNELKPEYIGFVFWEKSKRNISRETAADLKRRLDPSIQAVGVFVDKELDEVEKLLKDQIIDVAQLHGKESEEYILELKKRTGKTVFKAFTIKTMDDVVRANESRADYVLVDSGKGSGLTFNWDLLSEMKRPYFLAGGLNLNNVEEAIEKLVPFAVDVSSGIETDGRKDEEKMRTFVQKVRG